MEQVVKTYRAVAQVPSIAFAHILNYDIKNKQNPFTLYSWWNQRCLERGKSVKFRQTYLINMSTKHISNLMPTDSSSEVITTFSPDENSWAVIRDIPPKENGSKKLQHLEIWQKSQLCSVVDLTALDVHGEVYADSEFGCFEWSPCGKKLLYIAEKKVPKSEPFYKQKAQVTTDDSGSGDPEATKGEEYVFREEWGEQLVGKHQPVVAVYDLEEKKIVLLKGIPDNLSPAQATWAPDGGIVGIAWDNEPRRLGLLFFTNRPSYVFHLVPDGNFKILSQKSNNAVRSPRFSPDGKKLIWLERPAGGPHHATHRLVKYCWLSGKIDIIVDILNNKHNDLDPLYFRGLYNQSLPKNCWSSDSIYILLSTPGPTTVTSCVINSDTKKITLLKVPDVDGHGGSTSLTILDFKEDLLLCSRSNLRYPSSLIVGNILSFDDVEVEWLPVTDWKCFTGLENIESVTYYTKATANSSPTVNEINALYLKPLCESGQKVPVIIWPHGGPHTNFVSSFSPCAAFFALLGYGVVMVNYRGSTGLGQDYVNVLLGKIGDIDVKDVHQVAEELTNSSSTNFDPARKVLFGGSHGGFLVTHLSGQYPDSFKAVASRNPVVDVSAQSSVTCSPDWCAVESGVMYSPFMDFSKDVYNKMYDASPIRHAGKVRTPTLLLLGKKDLCVPCSQGLQYFYMLKAHNIKTKILMYDDSHPLSQVPVEMDSLINSALWFNEHLTFSQA